MSNYNASKTFGSNAKTVLYETEAQRLQRQADNFTKKLEQEKRRQLLLEDRQKEQLKEFTEKKAELHGMRPCTKEQKRKMAELKLAENHLDKTIVKYNQIIAENHQLKCQVDALRKELNAANAIYNKLQSSIKKREKDTMRNSTQRNEDKNNTEETHIQILALKTKHDKERTEFNQKINELKTKLKERDELRKLDERGPSLDNKQHLGKTDKKEYSNPLDILKLRLDKWHSSNVEKKQIIEKYIKNSRVIEDAFEQIKESTGIGSIEEIVTTFIKSEEQNYALYNYVNNLTQELETLEDQNRKLNKQIMAKEANEYELDSQQKEQLGKLSKELESLKANISQKEKSISDYKASFEAIQVPVASLLDTFKKSKVILTVGSGQVYDTTTVFNENNILGYLAEAEEYIDNLLATISQKHEQDYPILSVLPLEKIHPKVFNPKLPKREPPQVGKEDETDQESIKKFLDKSSFYEKVSTQFQLKHSQMGEEQEENEEEEQTKLEDKPTKKPEKRESVVNMDEEYKADDLPSEMKDDKKDSKMDLSKEENKIIQKEIEKEMAKEIQKEKKLEDKKDLSEISNKLEKEENEAKSESIKNLERAPEVKKE